MLARVQRWGNSLALRIPKALAEQVGIGAGSAIDLVVNGGTLTIRPVAPPAFDLDELLSRVTDDNLHDEADFGGPQGDETW